MGTLIMVLLSTGLGCLIHLLSFGGDRSLNGERAATIAVVTAFFWIFIRLDEIRESQK